MLYLAVLALWLDLILEVPSKLNNFMICFNFVVSALRAVILFYICITFDLKGRDFCTSRK